MDSVALSRWLKMATRIKPTHEGYLNYPEKEKIAMKTNTPTLILIATLLYSEMPLIDAPTPTAPVCVQYCIEGVQQ